MFVFDLCLFWRLLLVLLGWHGAICSSLFNCWFAVVVVVFDCLCLGFVIVGFV